MARKSNRKCVLCGQPILDESEATPYKKGIIHTRCLNSGLGFVRMETEDKLAEKAEQQKKNGKRSSAGKSSTAKPKAELKEGPVDEEGYQEKKQFYTYLRMLMDKPKEEKFSPKIYALVQDYESKYGLTYKDMYNTLVYLHEIIEKELTGDIVGIIPYYSEEAAKYYIELESLEEKNKEKDVSKMYQKKVITISTRKRRVNQIDITSVT